MDPKYVGIDLGKGWYYESIARMESSLLERIIMDLSVFLKSVMWNQYSMNIYNLYSNLYEIRRVWNYTGSHLQVRLQRATCYHEQAICYQALTLPLAAMLKGSVITNTRLQWAHVHQTARCKRDPVYVYFVSPKRIGMGAICVHVHDMDWCSHGGFIVCKIYLCIVHTNCLTTMCLNV